MCKPSFSPRVQLGVLGTHLAVVRIHSGLRSIGVSDCAPRHAGDDVLQVRSHALRVRPASDSLGQPRTAPNHRCPPPLTSAMEPTPSRVRLRGMRSLVAATAVVVVLSACGAAPPPAGDLPRPAPSPPGSAGTDSDCGAVVLRQGELLEVAGATERACLERPCVRSQRDPQRQHTHGEGRPIVTSWRLGPTVAERRHRPPAVTRYAGSPPRTRASCGVVTSLPSPLECGSSGRGRASSPSRR